MFPGKLHGSQYAKYDAVPVSSNDLVYDGRGVSTGEVAIPIAGSFGKHRRFLDLVTAARATPGGSEQRAGSTQRSLAVYVGDSVTDLLAMLDADVGIVVGDCGTFARVANAFGISVRPLASAYEALEVPGRERGGHESAGSGCCIYRVSHWAEIEVFLFGGG